jgi:hypothetical protein
MRRASPPARRLGRARGLPNGKFQVAIGTGSARERLGEFVDEREAAEAYDARARELGHHAWCNFDEDDLA